MDIKWQTKLIQPTAVLTNILHELEIKMRILWKKEEIQTILNDICNDFDHQLKATNSNIKNLWTCRGEKFRLLIYINNTLLYYYMNTEYTMVGKRQTLPDS